MIIRIHANRNELKKLTGVLKKITVWIVEQLKLNIASLDIIFVAAQEFRSLHRDYLDDDRPSDVVTFNLADGKEIEGEIYISLDQVKDQATFYKVTLLNEISRLIIHGCLHLAGFSDTKSAQRRIMKKKEEYLLSRAMRTFVIQ
jgi:probable rRNA maturation factor